MLGANYDGSDLGVLIDRPGQLSNDFFVNLLDLGNTWTPVDGSGDEATRYECTGPDGEKLWTGSRVDLVFSANSELRALGEVYGADDSEQKFADDFVAAWHKVMDLDRYDV